MAVVSGHDLDLVEDMAACCHVFQRGRIVAAGTPSEILQDNALLLSANLVCAHRHAHASGEAHATLADTARGTKGRSIGGCGPWRQGRHRVAFAGHQQPQSVEI